jgi:hypothetical protein
MAGEKPRTYGHRCNDPFDIFQNHTAFERLFKERGLPQAIRANYVSPLEISC